MVCYIHNCLPFQVWLFENNQLFTVYVLVTYTHISDLHCARVIQDFLPVSGTYKWNCILTAYFPGRLLT